MLISTTDEEGPSSAMERDMSFGGESKRGRFRTFVRVADGEDHVTGVAA